MKFNWASIRTEDFLEILSEAVIVANRDQIIIYFNSLAEIMWGYTADDVEGQPLNVLLPDRYHETHSKFIEQFITSQQKKKVMLGRKDVIGKKRDGTEFPVEANIAKLSLGDETVIVALLRDISERKQAEKELAKWAQAFEHAEWGVVVGEANIRNLQVMNSAFAKMYGYSVDELRGQPISSVYAPSERAKVESLVREAHEKGHITFESTHIRKDQTEFPVMVNITAVKDEQGVVLYRVVNVTDLTELKKARQALWEIEQLNTKIIEVLSEGVLSIDQEGRVLSCNASAEIILGIPREQMMGEGIFRNDWTVLHEDGSPCGPTEYPAWATAKTGRAFRNVLQGLLRPGGTIQWLSVNTHPLIHSNGAETARVLVSFADVTERMQMYRLLQERVAQSTRELSALLEVSRNLVSTLDLIPLLKIILQQLRQVVEFSGAAIARLVDGEFILLEYLGPVPREVMLKFRTSVDLDTGYRRVLLAKQPYIIGDMWVSDPWLSSLQNQAESDIVEALRQTHSWMGVPLIAQDQVFGVLRLDHSEANYFTQHDAELVTSFAELAAIAIRNADSYEHVQMLAALEERQKLARELHDSVSQALYGIALGARTARTLLDRDPAKAADPLDYCLHLAETGLAEMRALIFELRPESLEKEGLVSALSKQAHALKARHQIETLTALGPEPDLSIQVKEAIYRIAQEALHNVVKHAQASKIEIRLAFEAGFLTLEIKDNGRGFDPSSEKPGHIGLHSMRERAERIGAQIYIESVIGVGSTVRLNLGTSKGQ